MTVMSEGLLLNSNYIKMGGEKGSLLCSRFILGSSRNATPHKGAKSSQVGK